MKTAIAPQATTLDKMLLAFEAGPEDSHWFQALQYLLSKEVPGMVQRIVHQAMGNAISEAIPQLTQAVYGAEFRPTAYTDEDDPVISMSAAAASLGISEEELLILMQTAEAEDGDDSYLLNPRGLHSTQ